MPGQPEGKMHIFWPPVTEPSHLSAKEPLLIEETGIALSYRDAQRSETRCTAFDF